MGRLSDQSQSPILASLMNTPGVGQFTILVIDDDDLVCSMVQELLEVDGHLVFAASGGEEALAIVGAVLPDLILVDRHMPGMNGLEVVQRLRADPTTSRVPIVAMTSASAHEANELTLAGCIAFIPKPFDPTEFRRLVAGIIAVTVSRTRRSDA